LFISRITDHREGVMPDLAVRAQVIGADDVAEVDLVPRHELVDLDGACRFQGDVFEFFLGDLDVGVGVDLERLDDVLVGDLHTDVSVHARVLYAMVGISVDLAEADLFRIGRGRIERDGTGDERKAQEAFPIGARGHGRELRLQLDSRRTGGVSSDSPPAKVAVHP
jgi:hypothetical protein